MENGPCIDGLPIKNGGSFHGYVSHNQMVMGIQKWSNGATMLPWDSLDQYHCMVSQAKWLTKGGFCVFIYGMLRIKPTIFLRSNKFDVRRNEMLIKNHGDVVNQSSDRNNYVVMSPLKLIMDDSDDSFVWMSKIWKYIDENRLVAFGQNPRRF